MSFRNLLIVAILFVFASSSFGQGIWPKPIKTVRDEATKRRADYPGPIMYGPQDPWTRSKLYQKQTGHHGLFYNCDDEECKRNSPYINWNAQQNADWRNGFKTALKRDWCDVKQRLHDGGCLNGSCDSCNSSNQHGTIYVGEVENFQAPVQASRQQVTPVQAQRVTAINTNLLRSGNRQLVSEPRGDGRQVKPIRSQRQILPQRNQSPQRSAQQDAVEKRMTNANNAAMRLLKQQAEFENDFNSSASNVAERTAQRLNFLNRK